MPGADAEALGLVEDREGGVHRGQLSSGSPMPMKTMLVGLSSGFRSTISRTWPAISNGVRLRRKPIRPVAQKAQRRAQPACEEMQSVRRLPVGISTDSIASPSASRQRYFRVPSADCWMVSSCRRGRGKAAVQLGPELRRAARWRRPTSRPGPPRAAAASGRPGRPEARARTQCGQSFARRGRGQIEEAGGCHERGTIASGSARCSSRARTG